MSDTPHLHYWEAWGDGPSKATGILHARCVTPHCLVGARAFTPEQWAREVADGHVSPNSWGWAAGTRDHLSIPPGQKRGS